MARRASRHRHRRAVAASRRIVTVAVSAVATVALGIGYAAGDLTDVVPGVLTLQAMRIPTVPAARTARAADSALADADRSIPVDAAAADALIDTFLGSEGVGSDVSIAIAGADGTVVAERNADIVREPASTLKTLTAVAAATVLDLSDTLDTETYLIQQEGQTPTLVLKGNGDMLLGAGASDPDHVNGRAGLGTLAAQSAAALRQRGIDRIRLVYDDTLFGEQRYPSRIEENNPDNLYYAPVSALAVDGGRNWNGDPPDDPDLYTGYAELSTQPAADAAATFATRLAENGITVDGEVTSGAAPQGQSPLTSVSSAQLNEIMAFMMRHSDNTLAEEFGRLTALAAGRENSPHGATQAVAATLQDLGVDTAQLTMADCSGLAPGSSLSVRTLIGVQSRILAGGAGSVVAGALSVPGLIGTAAGRLDDEAVAGLLRVKTGTLGTVTSMAGNVSRLNGGVLCFAVVVNNPENAWEAAHAVDVFMADLPGL